MKVKFEIYPEQNENLHHDWRWRLRSRNGLIVADGGEGYKTEQGVRKAVRRLQNMFLFGGYPVDVVKVDS